jgi:hypothetical protein
VGKFYRWSGLLNLAAAIAHSDDQAIHSTPVKKNMVMHVLQPEDDYFMEGWSEQTT